MHYKNENNEKLFFLQILTIPWITYLNLPFFRIHVQVIKLIHTVFLFNMQSSALP